jgi:LCP family protein required for cell wall assembly
MTRRWRRIVISAAVALVVLVGGGAIGVWAYGHSLNSNLKRTNAFSGIAPSTRPTEAVTGALNVLMLGSDSRDPASTADSRSDTLMLLHLDANHQHAYVISIPRDTWVYVPESANGQNGNTMAKINSAYSWGGVPLTVQTVEGFTGVRIDHVVVIDFAGFQQVVDALGGVTMNIDQSITSIFPPYRTFTAGSMHLTGAQALDYVRQRYQFANGDFAREQHQQEFLLDLLNEAAATSTLDNPLKLNSFLRAVTKSVTVDQSFNLVNVALQLRSLRSNDVSTLASPSAGTGTEGDQSVVFANSTKAKALYQAVTADTVAQYLAANPPTPSTSSTSSTHAAAP